MTWPPTWDRPHFKELGSKKVATGLKREKRAAKEKTKKTTVRGRDKYCRFPLCGCKRFRLALHVSHQRHKGMGGNPKEDRSEPELMVLVCSARHRENVMSIDQKTIRWKALTPDGADGPIAWDVDARALLGLARFKAGRGDWMELARETAIHVYEPITSRQRAILEKLAGMEI